MNKSLTRKIAVVVLTAVFLSSSLAFAGGERRTTAGRNVAENRSNASRSVGRSYQTRGRQDAFWKNAAKEVKRVNELLNKVSDEDLDLRALGRIVTDIQDYYLSQLVGNSNNAQQEEIVVLKKQGEIYIRLKNSMSINDKDLVDFNGQKTDLDFALDMVSARYVLVELNKNSEPVCNILSKKLDYDDEDDEDDDEEIATKGGGAKGRASKNDDSEGFSWKEKAIMAAVVLGSTWCAFKYNDKLNQFAKDKIFNGALLSVNWMNRLRLSK